MSGIHISSIPGLFDLVKILEEHFHSAQEVYPPSADSLLLTSAASIWTHGTKVEIVPAAGIVEDFDLHFALLTALSANGEYEVIFYSGAIASEVEICRVATSRDAVQSKEGSLPIMTELLPKDTRISASLATNTGNANTCNVKLFYHEY